MFCSCNTNCATQRCGCLKAGLRCSQVCKNCSGITCNNAQPVSMSTVDEEDINDLSANTLVDDDCTTHVQNSTDNDRHQENVSDHDMSDLDEDLAQHLENQMKQKWLIIRDILNNTESDEDSEEERVLDYNDF